MLTFIKADFAKGFLGKLVSDNDTKTTVLGAVAASLLVAGLDWGKVFHGDQAELGKLAGGLVVALLGYYTNKPGKSK